MNFQTAKAEIFNITDELVRLGEKSSRQILSDANGQFLTKLQQVRHQVETQRFEVGVVGVFNCGKSTFLNALLGQDTLSAHILPETAAITTLSDANNELANIYFWTKEEWARIREQAERERQSNPDSDLLSFVKEAEKNPLFSKRVTAEGYMEREVAITELSRYTSANHEDGLARLVKEVELGVNTELCQDNIMIVDTPGLNDPIKMREQITKRNFLPRCDLMVFLLPATMAFTMYDREFLKEQLRENRLHKLFVVINQIDRLNHASEVPAVEQWARQQIERTFREAEADLQNEGRLSETNHGELANRIELFSLSAYQAFLHRVGRGSEARWTEEESRVPEFEQRLRTYLFEGERAEEFLKSVQGKLKAILHGQVDVAEQERIALSNSLEELNQQIEQQKAQAKTVNQKLDVVRAEAERSIARFDRAFDSHRRHLLQSIRSDVPRVLERQAMEMLDEYLEEANIKNLVHDIKDWFSETFEPAIQQQAQVELERVTVEAMREIEREMALTIDDITQAYHQMSSSLELELPELGSNFNSMLLDVLKGAAMGLALREAGVLLVGYLGGAAAAATLAGPVGWAILGVTAIITVLVGVSSLRKKIRAKVQAELPAKFRESFDNVANEIGRELEGEKPNLVQLLRNAAFTPAMEIETQLEEKMNSLQELLKAREEEDFNRQQQEAALERELSVFSTALGKVEQLTRGEAQ